jgi:hypothetical protein
VFDEEVFPFYELHHNVGARLHSEINLLHPTLLNPGRTHVADQFTNINPVDLIGEEHSGTNGGENTYNVNRADQFTNISAGGISAHAHNMSIQELPPPCTSSEHVHGRGIQE